jgi:hypothetical protein
MTIYRHVAKGSLINGEIFTFSVHSQKAAGDITDAHSAWATALGLLWNGAATPADSIKQLYPAATTVDELVTTELDAVTGKNVIQAISAPALVGTGSGAALPPQLAICVSLRTALPTRAGRGRFFLPAPIVTESTVGRINSTGQGQVALAAVGMLQSMQSDLYPVVILHKSTMTTDLVISTDVGDVFDTITRRRDKLVEVRVSHVV